MQGDFESARQRPAIPSVVPQSGDGSPESAPQSGVDAAPDGTSENVLSSQDGLLSAEDLDRLYREALQVMEAAASDLTEACTALSQPDPEVNVLPDASRPYLGATESAVPAGTSDSVDGSATIQDSGSTGSAGAGSPVMPHQIIEAALFVGGVPLTARKLCALFHGDFDHGFVEQSIEELNRRYSDEGRPYWIRLGEGGYRMALRPEFEPVRNRVYGVGPKEVRLSQEALEILALVAYRQPISRNDIDAAGRENAGSVLRHLLRRELVAIQRVDGGVDVNYVTTPRFLELFGLARLDELPQADEIDMK